MKKLKIIIVLILINIIALSCSSILTTNNNTLVVESIQKTSLPLLRTERTYEITFKDNGTIVYRTDQIYQVGDTLILVKKK